MHPWLAMEAVGIWRLGNLSTPKTVQKLQKALHAKAKAGFVPDHLIDVDGIVVGHFPFAFSPSSTRRRMASDSDGMSGWFSAQRWRMGHSRRRRPRW